MTMIRTPGLHAVAAALGVLAGFAISPADAAPLERAVQGHAVTVAWDVAGPGRPDPAGVRLDDGSGRLPAELPRRLAPVRAHPPVRKVRDGEAAQVKAHLTLVRMEKRRACHREHREI
jgi:hypothetical protein